MSTASNRLLFPLTPQHCCLLERVCGAVLVPVATRCDELLVVDTCNGRPPMARVVFRLDDDGIAGIKTWMPALPWLPGMATFSIRS